MTPTDPRPAPPAPASMLFPRETQRLAPEDIDPSIALARRYLEYAPAASAVVSGAAHGLVFANATFRRLAEDGLAAADVGIPIVDMVPAGAQTGLTACLDRVRRDGAALRDSPLGPTPASGARSSRRATWSCDVWPVIEDSRRLDYMVVTLRAMRRVDDTRARQRAITERLLLTALKEQERARRADRARARAVFLAEASLRLRASLDLEAAYTAVAMVALPTPGAWSIVDVAQADGSWRRLDIVHPDPVKQGLIHELDGHWSPAPGDPLGAPLMAESRQATIVQADTGAVVAAAAHGAENHRILRALDLGALLVVPLIAHDQLRGAITFVNTSARVPYTADDLLLAEELAVRCADVLEAARRHEEARLAHLDADIARHTADLARKDAERANEVKTSFLTSMSHELRTPLNAILGYAELLAMGLRGPVSPEQRDALSRIRRAGTHLLSLINDVLNFAKLKALQVPFLVTDVPVDDVFVSATMMVEPQAAEKGLTFVRIPNTSTLAARGDREKVLQILLNLLSNAIKFTDAGGRVTLAASALYRRRHTETDRRMQFKVSDTGRGIAADQLRIIFEPFVQVGQRLAGTEVGTGLGLAISRELARGMGGDLVVESTLGVGSLFTLTMPCAAL
jgi:signal transduction histidine kinase